MIAASGFFMPGWFEWLLSMIIYWPVTLAVIVASIGGAFAVVAWRKRKRRGAGSDGHA